MIEIIITGTIRSINHKGNTLIIVVEATHKESAHLSEVSCEFRRGLAQRIARKVEVGQFVQVRGTPTTWPITVRADSIMSLE